MVKKRLDSLRNFHFILVLLLLAVFLVSGQQGCQPSGVGTVKQTVDRVRTEAARQGVDFSFQKGIEYLSAGKEILAGDLAFVNVIIESHDDVQKAGDVCIRDDVEDIYGGISSSCKNFLVPAAIYEEGKLKESGRTNVLFGEYRYEESPIEQNVNVFVTLRYTDQFKAEALVPVPEPETQSLQVKMKPSPLDVKIDKRVALKTGGYGTDLTIKVSKSNKDVKITTPDFAKEGIIIDPQLSTTSVNCDYSDPTIKLLEFKEGTSTSIIKCSALLPREETINYPLLVNLIYGAELEKKFSFKLKKEESK